MYIVQDAFGYKTLLTTIRHKKKIIIIIQNAFSYKTRPVFASLGYV